MDWGVSERSSSCDIDILKKINNKLMSKTDIETKKVTFIQRQVIKLSKFKLYIKKHKLSQEDKDIFLLSPGTYNKKYNFN